MENPSNGTQGGLVGIGNISFSMANVIQLAFFICAFLAQWYGIAAQIKEQKIVAESDKQMVELKLQVLESKFQALELRLNSLNQNNLPK